MSIKLIRYKNLDKYTDIIQHFSSTRIGGVSERTYASLNLGLYSNDKPQNITNNRALLCAELGITDSQLINAHQVHGIDIKRIDNDFLQMLLPDQQSALEAYDALITNVPNVCIAVTTADCVPIILFDPQHKAVGAIHSGWRSTLNNITKETIVKMQEVYGTQSQQLVAAIGPCISQSVYEVGEDVFSAFVSKDDNYKQFFIEKNNQKYLFDIRATVCQQLEEMEVTNIEVSEYCTFTNDDLFFSARKLGLNSGRMLSGIMIKK